MTDKSVNKDNSKNDKDKTLGKSDSNRGEAVLNDDVRIQTGEVLSHLSKGEVKAYRAVSNSRHGADLFALICTKALTPRFLTQQKYNNVNNPNLCRLIDFGKVFWPLEKKECYCFIYEDTLGNPIINRKDKNPALGWKPETVVSNIVTPMIGLLTDCRNKELFHGEIWPGNLFDGGAKAGQKINVGECLATPAGSQMPSLYEPIERALADSIGRGMGDITDDLYSFGASLAIMLRSEDPMAGMSEEEIIEHKIEKGSYATLLGQQRLSGAVLELLRGLLYDDPKQRWTVEDLEAWQDGRRLSPKQSPKRVKATRPMLFNNEKYTRPEMLGKDLHLDTAEAVRLVENNELIQWVERAIEDKMVKSKLEQFLQYMGSYERGGSYNDRATVAVAYGLFSECPVRYKNISFQHQGFGQYLTQMLVEQKTMDPFVDIIKYNFLIPMIRESRYLEKSGLIANFDSARSAIVQKSLSFGLERCLYVLNPEAPCLSPLLANYYVRNTKEMMDAFEDICSKSMKSAVLFDRHIVAFLSVKDKQNIDPYLSDLGGSDPRLRILAQLKVLATIQKRLNLGAYPEISAWVEHNFTPVFDRFHDSEKLEQVKKKLKNFVHEGDLKSIAFIFDDAKLYEGDTDGFFEAMRQYQALVEEQKLIKKALKKGSSYGQSTGRQIASVISMGLSFLIMMFAVYKTFLGG